MRHLFASTLLCTAIICSAAYADERPCCRDESNWYAGGSVGGVLPKTQDLDMFGAYYDLSTGVGFSGLVGYQFFPNASVELEMLGQISRESKTNIPSAPGGPSKGDQSNYAVMLNHRWIYRDAGAIAPYFGIGGGVMNIQTPSASLTYTSGGSTESHKIQDTVLAYQLMAGVNFQVPNSKVEFYGGYRYIGTQEGEVQYSIGAAPKAKFDGSSHNVEIGGRIHF